MSRGVTVGLIPLEQIQTNPLRVRLGLGDLWGLAESIERHGVLVPVVVERCRDGYRLRFGHRRVAAARLAGFNAVPAVIHPGVMEEKAYLLMAAEETATSQRLAASDRVRTAARLRVLGCSWRQIAASFGVSPKAAAGWVAGDDDDTAPRAGNPRRRALQRLVAAHPDEFERLLGEERDRDEIHAAPSSPWQVAA